MGIIGKTNGKIGVTVNKLDSKIRIVVNYLPHAALARIIAVNYSYNNVRIVVSNLNSKIRVLGHYLNPAIQRNAFASAGITIDRFSGSENRKQCEYKTTY